MILKFRVNVPFLQRLKILYYGQVFVCADYRGQHEITKVQIGAVNKKGEPA